MPGSQTPKASRSRIKSVSKYRFADLLRLPFKECWVWARAQALKDQFFSDLSDQTATEVREVENLPALLPFDILLAITETTFLLSSYPYRVQKRLGSRFDDSLKDEIKNSNDDLAKTKKNLAASGEAKATATGDLSVTSKDHSRPSSLAISWDQTLPAATSCDWISNVPAPLGPFMATGAPAWASIDID